MIPEPNAQLAPKTKNKARVTIRLPIIINNAHALWDVLFYAKTVPTAIPEVNVNAACDLPIPHVDWNWEHHYRYFQSNYLAHNNRPLQCRLGPRPG